MTGFGTAQTVGAFGVLSVELRSVNNRFLDVFIKLPEEVRSQEGECRQLIQQAFTRGKVEVFVRIKKNESQSLTPNNERLAALREACNAIGMEFGPTAVPDPLRILAFPGILAEQEVDNDALKAALLSTVKNAVTQLKQARQAEGVKLAQLLQDRGTQIADLVAQARIRLPQALQTSREKLMTRLTDIAAGMNDISYAQGRLEQELVILAQRWDVAEECDRLMAHVSALAETLKAKDAVGRKLDFLMQEFNREANTLGSKSQDTELTQIAMQMKVLIEQMREQVQNIE